MYKAVFTDMDGTLLRRDHTVSAATQHSIKNLVAKGILVVPISARPLHGMQHITGKVFPAGVPVVSLNGSYIFHNDNIIYQASMSVEEATAIHDITEQHPVSAMYYSQMEWYAHTHTDAIKKEQKITTVPISIQPFTETCSGWQLNSNGPNKILIAGDEKKILTVEKEMLERFGTTLNIYKSQPRYLEAMNATASKANAIRLIMELYGLKQDEIIAIGDNYNDKGMIEFAGMGIAMGNAPDEIKAVAGYVTDTNNHEGVAKALDHFFG